MWTKLLTRVKVMFSCYVSKSIVTTLRLKVLIISLIFITLPFWYVIYHIWYMSVCMPSIWGHWSVRLLEVLNIDLVVISRLFIEYYCIGIRAVSSQFKCKSYIKVFALIKIYFKIWFNDSPPRTDWPISATRDSRTVSISTEL